MLSTHTAKIAIVGFGPRALGALESLAGQAIERGITLAVDIFDPTAPMGAGPNYHPDQSDLCLLNIPARIVDYRPPTFMQTRIGPFLEWSDGQFEPDDFPPRSSLGAYFNARFEALKQSIPDAITIRQSTLKVTDITCVDRIWRLSSNGNELGRFDEVLLSQGQPATAPDQQLGRWLEHADDHDLTLLPAYPADQLMSVASRWENKTVAIRGLGLSTLDVVRMVTKGVGGKFVKGHYKKSGREPLKIIPFSLDGRPPIAKPATRALDQRFDPRRGEIETFEAALSEAMQAQPTEALEVICEVLIAPVSRIHAALGGHGTLDDVRVWFDRERQEPGSQDTLSPVDGLRADIAMAYGKTPPTIGYVAGQIWRKLQDKLRDQFTRTQPDVETANAIIGFDEAFKRYSYGPPVFAAEELLVLIEAGIVGLGIVDDPDVALNEAGWLMREGDDVRVASVMIDAVLPGPDIERVKDPLIERCLEAGYAMPKSEGLGLHTLPDGQLIDPTGATTAGLCLLGRLALGSVIAVDGLDDCFGPAADRWASGVLERVAAYSTDPSEN